MSAIRPILLAEDDPNDVFFFKRALQKSGVSIPVTVVHNGQEAVDYLGGVGVFANRTVHPLPVLIVLDLKMPIMSGFDVLEWIRFQPDICNLPLVVLSSSELHSDREKAHLLGASEYRVKPPNAADLVEVM